MNTQVKDLLNNLECLHPIIQHNLQKYIFWICEKHPPGYHLEKIQTSVTWFKKHTEANRWDVVQRAIEVGCNILKNRIDELEQKEFSVPSYFLLCENINYSNMADYKTCDGFTLTFYYYQEVKE